MVRVRVRFKHNWSSSPSSLSMSLRPPWRTGLVHSHKWLRELSWATVFLPPSPRHSFVYCLCIFFGQVSIQIFPYFNWVVCVRVICMFWDKTFISYVFANIFLLVCDLSFDFVSKVIHRVQIFNFIKSMLFLVFIFRLPFCVVCYNSKAHDLHGHTQAHVNFLL